MFKSVSNKVAFPKMEEEILSFWEKDGTFKKSLKKNEGKERYKFYDGPPFATGHGTAALRALARGHDQGHRAALPDDARKVRRTTLRLGHPRPSDRGARAGGARRRGCARNQEARRRQVQRAVPLDGAQVRRRMAQDRNAHGPLGRLRQRLQDDGLRLHGVGVVGLQAALEPGPRLPLPPHHAVFLEAFDAALQLRGRLELQGRPGPDRDVPRPRHVS